MNGGFDLEAYLHEKRTLVEEALEQALPLAEGNLRHVTEAMRYSLFAGGKRMRPILCLACAEAVGASARMALPGAAAVEMIHTSSLIHDDLPGMDDDDLRRGKPSNHKVYGEGTAILAGDGLLIEGLSILPRMALAGMLDPIKALAAHQVLARATGYQGMVGGQSLDLAAEGREVGVDVIREIHIRKTASLISAAAAIGGILGGAGDIQVNKLETYGMQIGLAFQIKDDILDIESETSELGKPVGSDLARGKATYPGAVGLDQAKKTAARMLNEAMEALEPFGRFAEPLRAVAYFLRDRKK